MIASTRQFKVCFHIYVGPPLPSGRNGAKMETTPDGNGVLLFGGYSDSPGILDEILQLKSDGNGWVGSWITLEAKLQYGRLHHVVIPICMAKDSCDLSGIVSCPTQSYIPML